MDKIEIKDFDYVKFVKALNEFSLNIDADDEFYDISIDVPDNNVSSVKEFLKNGEYSDLVFDYGECSSVIDGCTQIYISMPVVKAVKIAYGFNGEIIWCENENCYRSLKIKDKDSDYSLWVNVDSDNNWTFNKTIFNTSNSKDVIDMSLQYNNLFINKITNIVDSF